MTNVYRMRRVVIGVVTLIGIGVAITSSPDLWQQQIGPPEPQSALVGPAGEASKVLEELPVKGRAPKTGYERSQFGDGWQIKGGCDMRNIILNRDLTGVAVDQKCKVLSGTLNDPYTGKVIIFQRGADTSDDVQIDHVVALSDAWQKGAQQLLPDERESLANDPLELIAVEGSANQQKSDGDAATWLPENKAFRCSYVARQIAVKSKYRLWVSVAEKEAMRTVLTACPGQKLPTA